MTTRGRRCLAATLARRRSHRLIDISTRRSEARDWTLRMSQDDIRMTSYVHWLQRQECWAIVASPFFSERCIALQARFMQCFVQCIHRLGQKLKRAVGRTTWAEFATLQPKSSFKTCITCMEISRYYNVA